MDFNKKIIEPMTKKGALKSYNDTGVKVNFDSTSDGHTFKGELDGKGKGKLTYKGKWMGFGLEKSFHTSGVGEFKLNRTRSFGGRDMDFKLGWKGDAKAHLMGDLDLGVKTAFTKNFMGGSNDFSINATTKFRVGEEETPV